MSFEVYNLFGFIEKSKISAEFSSASINDLSLAGHIDYNEKIKNKLNGEITFDNYKIPEKIKFSDSALPRIASQKLDRVGVKDLLSS